MSELTSKLRTCLPYSHFGWSLEETVTSLNVYRRRNLARGLELHIAPTAYHLLGYIFCVKGKHFPPRIDDALHYFLKKTPWKLYDGDRVITYSNLAIANYIAGFDSESRKYANAVEDILQRAEVDENCSNSIRVCVCIYKAVSLRNLLGEEVALPVLKENEEYFNELCKQGFERELLARYYLQVAKCTNELHVSLKAIELAPDFEETYSHHAFLLDSGQRTDWVESFRFYEKSLKIDPKSVFTHHNMACRYRENGDIDSSIKHSLEEIVNHPSNYHAYANLGECYSRLDQVEASIETLLIAVTLNPYDFSSYVSLSWVIDRTQYPQRALPFMRKALKLNSRESHYIFLCRLLTRLDKEWEYLEALEVLDRFGEDGAVYREEVRFLLDLHRQTLRRESEKEQM